MMLPALEALTKARLQGARPAVVLVTLGNVPQPQWWRDKTTVEVVIDDKTPIGLIDFRSLVRCDVILIASRRDARLRQATEMICEQASRVTVLSSTDPDDLGHTWERDAGWRKFGRTEAA